jgi:hypothetical protein
MNSLVVIGNGFDLAHGLKTRYYDFIIWYLNTILNEISTSSLYMDELLTIHRTRVRRKFRNVESSQQFLETLSTLENGYTLSPFFQKLLEKGNDLAWVDIESEYYNYLVNVYSGTKGGKASPRYADLLSLNKSLSAIKKKLIEYLKTINVNEVKENPSISTQIERLMLRIKKKPAYTGVPNNKICFLNFNYTSTIETYLKKYNLEEYEYQLINIHGNLKLTESVIFGYGDMMDMHFESIENMNDNEYLKHIKHYHYLQKPEFHSLIQFLRLRNMGSFEKYQVNIMGHSCGVSDRVLLNRIFDPETCSKIKVFYYQKNESENDFFEKTQNIARHFDKEHKRNMEIICNKEQCEPLGVAKKTNTISIAERSI